MVRSHPQSRYGKAFARACEELRRLTGRQLEESDRGWVEARTSEILAAGATE